MKEMFEVIETVISEGNYVLTELLVKIDYFFAKGTLTEEEYATLKAKARTNAIPSKETDLFKKVMELEARVNKLEENGAGNTESTVEEYVVGKWYYAGDKCKWNGEVYACIAPEGVACVWNPSDYPLYWSKEA